ncbi:hypothetical protein DPMN_030180 [Dreissena polymorpha]|uniref:Uncharacterized protein n=1 Tax=Dreissena polymorpha TaxID=45954 RepID=A0A9D4LZG4_DREPO|nr:hypothetical protein DPMN_030180 [Dreissena polymorpha]
MMKHSSTHYKDHQINPVLEDVSGDGDLYDLIDSCPSVSLGQNNNVFEGLVDDSDAKVGGDGDSVPVVGIDNVGDAGIDVLGDAGCLFVLPLFFVMGVCPVNRMFRTLPMTSRFRFSVLCPTLVAESRFAMSYVEICRTEGVDGGVAVHVFDGVSDFGGHVVSPVLGGLSGFGDEVAVHDQIENVS